MTTSREPKKTPIQRAEAKLVALLQATLPPVCEAEYTRTGTDCYRSAVEDCLRIVREAKGDA